MALTPVTTALDAILAGKGPLPATRVPLTQALGRVLAEDLVALRTQPPADVSAMDGYALRHQDAPPLMVIGESAAGRPCDRGLQAGEAVRIFTGAPVPEGADCVLIQEEARRDGDALHFDVAPQPRQHIRTKGLDFTKGAVALKAGTPLNARALALAAAMNHANLNVVRAPRVALFSTGDELKPPGSTLGPADIVSSNAVMLSALMHAAGAAIDDFGIVPDTLEATVAALRRARAGEYDLIVTSGGASVGDYDFLHKALAHEGATHGFWKIAMRPGKPLMMADFGPLRLIGLPGNPVSAFVGAELFVKPLILRLAGHRDVTPPTQPAVLGRAMKANDQRADYVRATLAQREGRVIATPVAMQDSAMMRLLAESQCLIVRPSFAPAAEAGEPCEIIII